MKPLRLTAQHYGPFETLDVELPLGAVAVIGPNGAGKSTLVNAVDRALFGSRSMGEWLTTGEADGAMSLTLEFEHAGQLYRVRRGFSAKGRGKPALDFERFTAFVDDGTAKISGPDMPPVPMTGTEEWHTLSRESIKETQSEIERTLGFTRDIFRASAFLVQGGSGSFTDPGLDPRQRKQMLCDLLGLDVYDRLLERVRARMIAIRDVTTRLQIQVEEAERELVERPSIEVRHQRAEGDVTAHVAALNGAELDHRLATEKLNASREVAAKLTAAREVLASRERELMAANDRRSWLVAQIEAGEAVLKLKAESEALAGRRESIGRELVQAREAETARNEHRRLVAERDRLTAESNALLEKERVVNAKTERVKSADYPACDRCHQPVAGEARAQTVKSLKTEALGHHTQAKQLEAEAQFLLVGIELTAEASARGPNAAKQAELENALRLASEAERTLATIAEREKVVEELAVEFAQIEVRLPDLNATVMRSRQEVAGLEAVAPTEDLEAAVAGAYGVLHEARNDVEGAKGRLLVAQAELDRLSRIETNAKENRAALAEHQRDLDVLLLAERAYGKAGIPALVLENRAIPLLEAKANEALSKLGGKTASARIELRTQREKKDGAGVVEALDIMVLTPEGFERRYESWSGGECMRLDIAIRLGLLALSGAEMGILILDEPGNLDESGKADLIALLDSVLALGISSVLLVSHDVELREAFDQTFEIQVGADGRSSIVGSAAPEAVPA